MTPQLIIQGAIPLFAKSGYHGITMRQIAASLGISSSQLHRHFHTKEALYHQVINQCFSGKSAPLVAILNNKARPEDQLLSFFRSLAHLLDQDENLRLLIQRELVDGTPERWEYLAKEVFADLFNGIDRLAAHFYPRADKHLLATTFVGLVLFQFQINPIRPFLIDSRPQHHLPDTLAAFAYQLVHHAMNDRISEERLKSTGQPVSS